MGITSSNCADDMPINPEQIHQFLVSCSKP